MQDDVDNDVPRLYDHSADLALVVGVTGSNLLDLWLVPHLDFGLGQDDIIPATHLFNTDGLRASFGADSL